MSDLVQASTQPSAEQEFAAPVRTFAQDSWLRFRSNRLAVLGLIMLAIIVLTAIVGPWLSPYNYSDQSLIFTDLYPSAEHWFGTDSLGRDLLVRVLYGARISLTVGLFASLINLTIGVIYGGISGFVGGKVDNIMMRIVDILYGVPPLLYIILLMVILQPGLTNILIAIGIAYWLDMARIVRGQILALKEQDYVQAARALGASNSRILLRHLIPNALGTIIVTATLAIPQAIFTEAFLSYIGLGVGAPMASWGVLASEGVERIRSYPFQLFFPAAAISITMLAFNFVGDGLRDALDPRTRRK